MESFLAANLRARRVEPIACRAATLLRRNPHLRISRLAAGLDVTERHLSRNFQAMFGTSPKQFARIARIESVWLARSQGASWADACRRGNAIVPKVTLAAAVALVHRASETEVVMELS
jgi:AraC-like DNA-binding protein